MSHGFKRISSYYISKAGNNSNAGTDPNAPKQTFQQVAAGDHTVGAGDYAVSGFVGSSPGQQPTFYADGIVAVRAAVATDLNIDSASFYSFKLLQNIIVQPVTNGDRYVSACFCKGCNFLGGQTSVNRTRHAYYSIFINSNFGSGHPGVTFCTGCTFINSTLFTTVSAGSFVTNSYFDFTSSITYKRLDPAGFNYNNVQGRVGLDTSTGIKYFAIQDQLIGTPQDNGYAVGVEWLNEANLIAAGYLGTVSGWNYYVGTCINRDPGFVDPANENYALLPTSNMLGKNSSQSGFIGAKGIEYEIKNSDHGSNDISVGASAQINTSDINAYVLSSGSEGYIDYVFPVRGQKLGPIMPLLPLNFNTDFAGATSQNNDVPDDSPLTAGYAAKTTTAASSGNTTQIIVPQGLIANGSYIRVNGQHRTVTLVTNSAPNDILTLSSALLAIVSSGVNVTYGTVAQLASLNPNRLTYSLRTRSVASAPSFPLVDSDWDNEIDIGYNKVGAFFNQDPMARPGLIIEQENVYGWGDNNAPTFYPIIELSPEWANVRIYLRDNFNHTGL